MSSPPSNALSSSPVIPERESPWPRRDFRVPRGHGELLLLPPRDEIPELIARNLNWAHSSHACRIANIPLQTLRAECRIDLLRSAAAYTSRWTTIDPSSMDIDRPLFMSGHQPQLVHPGAWAKNLLLGILSRKHQAIAINLVVDNDLAPSLALNLPAGSLSSPRLERLPFDAASEPQPWEEVSLQDRELVRTFPERASQLLQPWKVKPVLPQVWSTVAELMESTPNWTTLLTAARNRFERSLGIDNLEIPISRVSELLGFRVFAADVLRRLPEFHSIHNRLLAEFRTTYKVRSTTHPFPELHNRAGWLEAPFWVWKTGETRRRPLMLHTASRTLELSDGIQSLATLSEDPERPENWKALLENAHEQGWKIRPRALTTTLFARLFLADLFLHGIGGSLYDEITNRLIQRFYRIGNPEFLTASAGLLLPLGENPVSDTDETALRHALWDLHQNPERHLPPGEPHPQLDSDIGTLSRLVRSPQRASQLSTRRELHRQVEQSRREIAPRLAGQADQLRQQLVTTRQLLQANQILRNREFSFALFPERMLRDFQARLEESVA